jgi:hypothetical protein
MEKHRADLSLSQLIRIANNGGCSSILGSRMLNGAGQLISELKKTLPKDSSAYTVLSLSDNVEAESYVENQRSDYICSIPFPIV